METPTETPTTPPAVDKPKRICPLTTAQIVEIAMRFVELFNEPCGVTLYSYQRLFIRRIVESLLLKDSATITGLFSRQSGKSEALACVAVAMAVFLPGFAKQFPDDPRLAQYVNGLWIGVFAPKQQQSDIIYDRVRTRAEKPSSLEIYADPDIQIAIRQSRGDRVSWTNGSFVRSQTASENSSVEGETYHLIIIDEAQLVTEKKVEKEIDPMRTATAGTMVKIGTASLFRGGFHTSIKSNIENHRKGGPRDHFEFDYLVVMREKRVMYERTGKEFHLNYEKSVAKKIQQLGGNLENAEFKMNYRLLWQEVNASAIEQEHFYRLALTSKEANEPNQWTRQVAGLDIGKIHDPSVLTIIEVDERTPIVDLRANVLPGDSAPIFKAKQIIAWHECMGAWEGQLTSILAFLRNYSIDTLVVDATGMGDPIAERLMLLLPYVRVVPLRFSHITNDILYKLYLQEIEAGRLYYCAGDETAKSHSYQQFVHQHLMLQKHYMGPYLSCAAPEGEHDDYCDSGALACYATTLPAEAKVEATSNVMYALGGDNPQNRADRYRRRW